MVSKNGQFVKCSIAAIISISEKPKICSRMELIFLTILQWLLSLNIVSIESARNWTELEICQSGEYQSEIFALPWRPQSRSNEQQLV